MLCTVSALAISGGLNLEGANHVAVHVIQGDHLDRRHRYIGIDCGDIINTDVAVNALLLVLFVLKG